MPEVTGVPTPEEAPQEWVRIPRLSELTTLPAGWLYELSRFDKLPGMHRAGKYVVVHYPTFSGALKRGDLDPRKKA